MYKIAIFSDIHSNFEVLSAIMNDINKNNFDEVICLGDTLGLGPNPKECLDLIINSNIKMILGNHELYDIYGTDIDDKMPENQILHHNWIAKNINKINKTYLMNCDLEYSINIYNFKIGFKHFLINKFSKDKYPFHSLNLIRKGTIREKLVNEDYDILFFGHEHRGFEININTKKFVCVGSSGCRKDNKTFYTILLIEEDKYSIEKRELIYDRHKFESKMKTIDYPDKETIEKIFFGIK